MSIEALLEANTAAVNRNSDLLERVIAGQEAAMAKLEGTTGGTTRKPRASKTEEKAPEPEKVETPAAEEPKGFLPKVSSADDLKGIISPWLNEVEKNTPEQKDRMGFLKGLADHLGVDPKGFFAAVSADADLTKQALFFFLRKKGGATVDFGAEYDFDGDPAQDATTSDDEFG